MLIDCFGGVWETADSLPIALRITSNNAPKFGIFRAQELHRHTVRKKLQALNNFHSYRSAKISENCSIKVLSLRRFEKVFQRK